MQGQGEFRIDILDGDGDVVGDFPIRSSDRITRSLALDRIGRWNIPMSVADPALGSIEGRDFLVLWKFRGATYTIGECSYLEHTVGVSGDSRSVTIEAASGLHDLNRQTVLQRTFDGASDDVNDVLNEIVPLRSGWTLGTVDTITTAAPLDFWYEPILEAVQLLAGTFGYHFREGAAVKTLDFGAFGDDSGVLAVGGDFLQHDNSLQNNVGVVEIEGIAKTYSNKRIVNQLIGFGGGWGKSIISLGLVTVEDDDYPVQTGTLPNGNSYYYIKDAASITANKLTERRFVRDDLRPITNSKAARQYSANIVYQATLATLLNLKDAQTIYSLSVAGLAPNTVKVGDKIRVLYRGWIKTDANEQYYLDIDDTDNPGQGKSLWILEIEETFGGGVSTRLKVGEVDAHEQTVEDLLAQTIRSFENTRIHVQPNISRYTVGPYVKRVKFDAVSPVNAMFSFELGDETMDVWYIKITITGEPLKASASTTASGGGSTSGASSQSTTASGGGTTTSSGSSAAGIVSGNAVPNSTDTSSGTPHSHLHNHIHSIPQHTHTVTIAAHTHGMSHTHSTPDHTHDLTYDVYEDSTRPDDLTIKVDGNAVASGVTLNAGNDYTYRLDITDDILDSTTLQQEHTVTIEPGSGRGEIVFQAQVLAVIQGIDI